jgi:hypothetical protein
MAAKQFIHRQGRRKIFFSNHALDRWWDRCKKNEVHGRKDALALLRERLQEATWESLPAWSRLSMWNRARAEGFLALDENSGFVVNQNAGERRDRVAVTYIENYEVNPDSYKPWSTPKARSA